MRILDRYLVREIIPPFAIGLLVLTFALMMPPILRNGEQLVAKGVPWPTVARVLWTLTPQALSITIPMALLVGILVALGRLSADREFVALQACGVSVFRVLRPIALLAIAGTAATAYETIIALPDANQTFREITFNIVASSAETDIKPRVFFSNFPNRILYVRDMPPGGTWRDVFFADDTKADQTTVYFARSGRLLIDRAKHTVQLLLEDGASHTTYTARPDGYDGSAFGTLILNMDAETVFPRAQIIKGDNEMTIAELRAKIAEGEKTGAFTASQRFTIQQKFAIPAACLVLSLIGLALGVNNRKEGKLATIAMGVGVIFVYYILLYSSRAAALAERFSPVLAPWVANALLGVAGIALLIWRARSADQPIRIPIPTSLPWRRRATASPASPAVRMPAPKRRATGRVAGPRLDWARPRLLDLYVARQYLAVFGVAFGGLVGIFYISTFIDLADKLFGGMTTTRVLLRYFYFQTPQYVYYIIPLSALVASLVTVGVLTKNSELIVMRACGISLYRSSAPLLIFAVLLSALLFELQERVLADSNREARRLNAIIRGYPPATYGVLNRRWLVGGSGDIYHYQFYDPRANHFTRLSMFHIDATSWKLGELTFAKEVMLAGEPGAEGQPAMTWVAHEGWRRAFTTAGAGRDQRVAVQYDAFSERTVSLEPPAYFRETEDPDADRMTFGELKQYITQLETSGYHAVPYMVQLQRKVAFPFVTLIMTLLAVPFAVTTGRRGAMSGIGVGIVFAIVYWTAQSIFGALGAGGWISPMLAAWAPNIMFGAAALYMVLTVRT
jgi:LPS export ABC transporter permease LptF/LPS export ABC transporter permease LptG